MKKNKKYLMIIFLFTIFYFILMPNYYVGDDSVYHTSNIIANASTTNITLFKILPLLEDNLGYGINLFYPPLPHLIGSYIYRIINNIELTMQILEFSSIFLAGTAMYYYIKIVFKNKEQALLTSLCYISMPYLLTDVFTRTALNESFLFYILPIIFLGLYYLTENNIKYFYLFFIIGFTLSIYTHLVLTVYITIISCIYLLSNLKKIFNKKKIIALIKASLIVLGLTSPFLIPLLEHYFLNNYYIFQIKYYIGQNFHFYPFYIFIFSNKMLSGAKNILKFHINMIALLLIECNYFLIIKDSITKPHKKILRYMTLIMILSILLESNAFIWQFIPNLLKNIQFPWRLSLFVAYTSSIIAGYGINLWKDKNKKYFLLIISILLLATNTYYIYQLPQPKKAYNHLNTDIYDNDLSWHKEYLPEESINNIKKLEDKNYNFKNNPNIKIIENKTPNMIIKAKNIEEDKQIELPRIYYLGYTLKDKNKKIIPITKSKDGMLEVTLKKSGLYTLTYEGTTLYKLSKLINIIALLAFIKVVKKIS